jgi:hypothetical protein
MDSLDLSVRQDQAHHLDELYALLEDVERQLQNPTLPHSDQQLLDQAWEEYTREIEELESLLDRTEPIEWHDATAYLESESEPSHIDPMTNSMPDDRVGCDQCVGCYYCRDSFVYDASDEI